MYRKKEFRELSMGAGILLLVWEVGLPGSQNLQPGDPDVNMQSLTKAFRFDVMGKGGGSCSSE